jgi:hypothetical protein
VPAFLLATAAALGVSWMDRRLSRNTRAATRVPAL